MGKQEVSTQPQAAGRRVKTGRSAILKAKKTLMRIKSIFARESNIKQNNLNSTKSKNLDNVVSCEPKCSGDKLTDIENMLHSETMLISQSQAELRGKIELFRRFMTDVNESMTENTEQAAEDVTPNLPHNVDNETTVYHDVTRASNVTSGLNVAFIGKRDERSLLNNAMIYSASCLVDEMSHLEITTAAGATLDYTDILNKCMVLDDSDNDSETDSESAFEDDDEICELERNICDEDLDNCEGVGGDVKHLFVQRRSDSTEEAIESFMNTVNRAGSQDEGLSSLGSDSL